MVVVASSGAVVIAGSGRRGGAAPPAHPPAIELDPQVVPVGDDHPPFHDGTHGDDVGGRELELDNVLLRLRVEPRGAARARVSRHDNFNMNNA